MMSDQTSQPPLPQGISMPKISFNDARAPPLLIPTIVIIGALQATKSCHPQQKAGILLFSDQDPEGLTIQKVPAPGAACTPAFLRAKMVIGYRDVQLLINHVGFYGFYGV
jgi:hypothetical protein